MDGTNTSFKKSNFDFVKINRYIKYYIYATIYNIKKEKHTKTFSQALHTCIYMYTQDMPLFSRIQKLIKFIVLQKRNEVCNLKSNR